MYSARSLGGIDGDWATQLVDTNGAIMIKPVVYIKNGTRAIAAFHTRLRDGCGAYYSDDDGLKQNYQLFNNVRASYYETANFEKANEEEFEFEDGQQQAITEIEKKYNSDNWNFLL